MKSFHKMSESELSDLKYAIAKQSFLDGTKFALSGDNYKLPDVIKLVAEDYADQVRYNEIDLLQS